MAEKKMKEIAVEEMYKDASVKGFAIYHRIGEVPVGEASVTIVAVSAHRKAAMEAVGNAIDILKEKVPIWKKEFYEQVEGESPIEPKWKQNPEFKKLLEKQKI